MPTKQSDMARGPSLPITAVFGLGAVSSGVVAQSLSALALLFYNQTMGMSPAAVGLALMISLIVDAFWDPAIGVWSDNVRSRIGRRHPFMYASVIPAGVAFWLLWNPPEGMSEAANFFYLLGTLVVVRFSISLYEIPSTSLAPEMAPDYDARTGLLAARYFCGVVGGVLTGLLAFQVFLSARAGGPLNPAGYAAYGITGGAIISVTLLISTIGTHGQIAKLAPAAAQDFRLSELARHIWSALSNRNFNAIMVSALFSGMASGVSSGLGMYFNLYFWDLSTDDLSLLALSGLFSSFVGVFLAPVVARRWGKKRVVLFLFGLSVFTSTLPMALRLLGLLPGNDWPWLLPFLFMETLIASMLGLMGMIVVTSMLADVVEDNAARTGHRSEGLFFAANSVLQKSVAGVGTFVSGLMLTAVAFPRNAAPGHVSTELMHQLGLIYLPVALALSVISLVTLGFFRIDRAAHAANLTRLQSLAVANEAVEDQTLP